jgi:hypothetical protein
MSFCQTGVGLSVNSMVKAEKLARMTSGIGLGVVTFRDIGRGLGIIGTLGVVPVYS